MAVCTPCKESGKEGLWDCQDSGVGWHEHIAHSWEAS